MSKAGPSHVPPLDPLLANPLDSTVEQLFDWGFMADPDPSLAPSHYPSAPNPKPDVWNIFEELFGKEADPEFTPATPDALAKPVVPLFSATSQTTSAEPLPVISTLTTAASTAHVTQQPESHPPQSTADIRAASLPSLQLQADERLQVEQSFSKKEPRKKTKHEKICQKIEDIDDQLASLRVDITDAKKDEKAELSSCFAEHKLTAPPSKHENSKTAKTAKSQIKKIKNKFSARISRLNTKIDDLKRDKLLLKKDLEIFKLRQQVKELQDENEQLRTLQGDPAASQQSAILWQSTSAMTKPGQKPEAPTTIASKRPELK